MKVLYVDNFVINCCFQNVTGLFQLLYLISSNMIIMFVYILHILFLLKKYHFQNEDNGSYFTRLPFTLTMTFQDNSLICFEVFV